MRLKSLRQGPKEVEMRGQIALRVRKPPFKHPRANSVPSGTLCVLPFQHSGLSKPFFGEAVVCTPVSCGFHHFAGCRDLRLWLVQHSTPLSVAVQVVFAWIPVVSVKATGLQTIGLANHRFRNAQNTGSAVNSSNPCFEVSIREVCIPTCKRQFIDGTSR